MKNHNIVLLVLLLIGASLNTASSQMRLGAKAGLNLANLNGDEELLGETGMLTTFMAGLVLEFDFSDNLGLGTGLQYQGKGAKLEDLDDSKVSLGYLQIPVQLQYRNNGFFAAAGPYFAFGIAGTVEVLGESEDIEFGNDEDADWSPTDFGLNFELGYEFGSLRATASYGLGLANGVPEEQRDFLDDATIKHSVIGIALTYLFGQGGQE